MASYSRPDSPEETDARPPFTVDLLADEIRKHRRLPPQVPAEPLQAAKWWIGMQSPAHEQIERPRTANVVGKSNAKRWLTPYADRMIASFRNFVSLTQKQQEFVIAAFEDGVFYNGDEPEMFALIYDETMRQRSMGSEAYQKEAVTRMRRLASRMTYAGS